MKRSRIMGGLTAMLFVAVSAVLLPSTRTRAEDAAKASSKLYHFDEKDYATMKAGGHGSVDLAEYVKTPNMTAGFARWKKGEALTKWPYWYEETVYITKGKGRISVSHAPFTSQQIHDVKPGDMLFFAKGSQVTFEPSTDQPLELLYVTTPDPLP
jgi:ethanolamine utilization protein EutQ (cupin superfamily)